MSKDNLIPINIAIADRQFRIKVTPEDEADVRQSVKLINDKVTEFKKSFPGKDMQDYISMVLVWFATDFKTSKNKTVSSVDEINILNKLAQIEQSIERQLAD